MTLPSGVKEIGNGFLKSTRQLESVQLSSQLERIGDDFLNSPTYKQIKEKNPQFVKNFLKEEFEKELKKEREYERQKKSEILLNQSETLRKIFGKDEEKIKSIPPERKMYYIKHPDELKTFEKLKTSLSDQKEAKKEVDASLVQKLVEKSSVLNFDKINAFILNSMVLNKKGSLQNVKNLRLGMETSVNSSDELLELPTFVFEDYAKKTVRTDQDTLI